MLRKRRFKYIFIEDAEPQIFDLVVEPDELHNLVGQREFQSVEKECRAEILSRFDNASITPDIEEKLKQKKIHHLRAADKGDSSGHAKRKSLRHR